MTHILLTGAGFSRNWGGSLANEAFEYLLGCPEVDVYLRDRLWKSKKSRGGFEDTLAELQIECATTAAAQATQALVNLEAAIAGMFNQMNSGLKAQSFDFSNSE
jgi:hypothetical protein